ncbi:MAG: sel1 repeat family protein [Clostridia bacterium]|nr:sel1 repeat family protein [Clostridia bacterium]
MKKNDFDRFIELARDARETLDESIYPATFEILCDLENSEISDFSAYIASVNLTEADKPLPFTEKVKRLVSELLEYEISTGNPDAMNDLGALFYEGTRGFGQNFSDAVRYYEMAVKNGSRQAQENLGYCYYYGRDIPVDYEKAFHCFALGAFDGHIISLYKIGDMYKNGYFVEKNEPESFRIYLHCLELMDEEKAPDTAGPLFLRLGDAFLYGIGTEIDAENALSCYQRAEGYLYKMVKDGNVMYRKSLSKAIDGQTKAREILENLIASGDSWQDMIQP